MDGIPGFNMPQNAEDADDVPGGVEEDFVAVSRDLMVNCHKYIV
jgi:hypothetical protein